VELTGKWTAHPADDELRRNFHERDLREDGWTPVVVPGHWASTPELSAIDGPLLYRHRFDATTGARLDE